MAKYNKALKLKVVQHYLSGYGYPTTSKFFNIDTSFLSGLEKLSLKYNLPIIFHEVKLTRKGYYHCTVHPPLLAADLKENQSITQYYANMLEQKIMEQPEIWLWSHKRWKHKKQ